MFETVLAWLCCPTFGETIDGIMEDHPWLVFALVTLCIIIGGTIDSWS